MVSSRAVRYGPKKNDHDFLHFFSISILFTILTQTDMLYSYKCILCEFETYFKRKPIRPFPKSCKMSLEQTWQNTYTYTCIYIYIYMYFAMSVLETFYNFLGKINNQIPLCVCALRSVVHGQSKRSANVPLTLR